MQNAFAKGVPFWGLLACTLALALGGGCRDRDTSPMPTMTAGPMATATLVDHGVDLLTAGENGDPCYELRIGGLARGDRTELSQYSCIQPKDQLSVGFLIVDGRQLAAGGAAAPSVVTVSINGQPALRDGRYFLAVLPTIPDSDVNVVASDKDGRVVSSQEYSRSLRASGSRARLHHHPGRSTKHDGQSDRRRVRNRPGTASFDYAVPCRRHGPSLVRSKLRWHLSHRALSRATGPPKTGV